MRSCPFCASDYKEKNDGKGIYYQCIKCNSRVYNFSLLKRLDFNSKLFTNFLLSAKQNQLKLKGSCISCGQSFREVSYKTNDYQTMIYVCPTCFLFAIKSLDLFLFKTQQKKPEKKYSAETEKLIKELDTQLIDNKKSWETFDQTMKISKSKAIGFFVFMFFLVILFVKLGFSYDMATPIGKIIFTLLFIVFMFAVLLLMIGKKNIFKVIKKYFSR
jgi:hypothetical protein